MIKIKTKKIKADKNNEYIGINYKVKNTSKYEHLVVVKHLLHELLKNKRYSKDELLSIVKMYIEEDK